MQVSEKPAMKGQKQDEAGEAKLRRGFSEAPLSSTADVLPCDSLPHQPLSTPAPSSVANIICHLFTCLLSISLNTVSSVVAAHQCIPSLERTQASRRYSKIFTE